MTSAEEQALLNDAEHMRWAQMGVNEAEKMHAIQNGLAKARRQTQWKKRHFGRQFVLLAVSAAAVAVLLLAGPLQKMIPQASPAAQIDHWRGLEPFKKLPSYNKSIQSAIQNGYVQMVNKSAEQDGYKITVNAVIADENELILLYSAATDSTQEIYNVNSVKLSDLSTDASLKNARGGGYGNTNVFYGRSTIELDRNQSFPEQLEADFQIASVDPDKLADPKTGTIPADMRYSPRLKVNFSLDPKFNEYATETVYPNQAFTLDGYGFTLSQVELSPLRIRAKFTLDDHEKLSIAERNSLFSKLSPAGIVSQVEGKAELLSNASGSGGEDGFEYVFDSNLLDKPQSLMIRLYPEVRGSRSRIVVDMNHKQIVSIPESVQSKGELSFNGEGLLQWKQKVAEGHSFQTLSKFKDRDLEVDLNIVHSSFDPEKRELTEIYQPSLGEPVSDRTVLYAEEFIMLKIK
ncbi:DUF4179 domain-containing protein [Paenibacillus albidus]|uniref:DUF4179 domain-containing protein n=1 Tax=Paenibacillus albidus TaxID=2041023 RepID=UPI001BEC8F77|nr:DUF4179 domain-containing protein [Paenibacillus albidus]MBT2289643.1 DUF4179 domain-containing protein [Paenibacillus albidus]